MGNINPRALVSGILRRSSRQGPNQLGDVRARIADIRENLNILDPPDIPNIPEPPDPPDIAALIGDIQDNIPDVEDIIENIQNNIPDVGDILDNLNIPGPRIGLNLDVIG